MRNRGGAEALTALARVSFETNPSRDVDELPSRGKDGEDMIVSPISSDGGSGGFGPSGTLSASEMSRRAFSP